MGDGGLGSDHINYLILRYLQEAGHENAAKALHQDWHRPDQYKDPEKLPFASRVKQSELVHIIQDGLFYDQTQAHVCKQTPRFNLVDTTAAPTKSSSHHTSGDARLKSAQPRRSSNNQRNDQDDFPLPVPKRVRKSNGDEPTPAVNGDAMDVDSKTPLTVGDDGRSDEGIPTDTDRAMSEAVDGAQTTSSPPRPVVETASEGTQTDKKLKAKKSETLYWSIDKEHAQIVHALWNPRSDMATNVLAAGDALCRFYDVPPPAAEGAVNGDDGPLNQTHHFDVEDMPRGSITTAACWHPTGRYATCAIEVPRQINGTLDTFRCLFDTDSQKAHGGKRVYSDNPYIQVLQRQNPVINMALRYNNDGSMLLSVSTSMKRGIIDIWQGPAEEPSAMKIFPKPIMDAVWADDNEIIICGEGCIEAYRVNLPDAADSVMTNGDSSDPGSHNLTLLYSFETDKMWGKVRYDSQNRVLAVAGVDDDDGAIVLLRRAVSDNEWTPLPGFPTASEQSLKQISAMAFEPKSSEQDADSDAILPRRLATTHHTGAVNIYAITNSSCSALHTLQLGHPHAPEAALALSWSPNGNYLAAASEESIRVWNSAAPHFPVLTWRASPEHWSHPGSDNGIDDMNDAEDVQMVHEPSLAWDAEGRSLLFASGKRMAVVRLLS